MSSPYHHSPQNPEDAGGAQRTRFRPAPISIILAFAFLLLYVGLTVPASAAEVTSLTIEQAHAHLADGDFSSTQLTRAYLRRIDKYEPSYNAFTSINPGALKEAEASDSRRAKHDSRGVLDGVPIVIKDEVDVRGMPTTDGWISAQAGGINLVPEHDAPLVARLRQAGAIILGKTNMPAFALAYDANSSWAGPTFNVLDRNWVPGGSSTGTATAVAADFAPAGIGEETGGSIQTPSVAQSLVGIKPSFGLVPNTGVAPLAEPTRDVLGPIAKTVSDAADVLNVISGYTIKDPKTAASVGNIPKGGFKADLSTTALAGSRIGLYGPGWSKEASTVTAGTETLYDQAIKTLEAQGATTVPDPFAGSGFASLSTGPPIGVKSYLYDLNNYLKNLGHSARVHSLAQLDKALGGNIFGPEGPAHFIEELFPEVISSVKHPNVAPNISGFVDKREKFLHVFNRVMDEKQVDALVFPATTRQIGKLYGGTVDLAAGGAVNIMGVPMVVLPAGHYPNRKPFSLVFIGRLWSEAQLIAYAYDYEQAAPGRIVQKRLATTPGPKPKKAK